MTKLEELKATRDAANAAAYAAWSAADAAAYDACEAADVARAAYEAELKKQKDKQNELELSTNEAHRTGR